MIFETILLNRLYKCNDFAKIKPRILKDKVVFALTENDKIGGTGSLRNI